LAQGVRLTMLAGADNKKLIFSNGAQSGMLSISLSY
jgi:hypothetical protein